MELLTPDVGLVFWTLIVFTLLVLVLAKFAWKPIVGSVKARTEAIENALKAAEKTKEEMAQMKAGNEQILAEAKAERDNLLKEARKIKEQMIDESKKQAGTEAEKILAQARETIEREKSAAVNDMKKQIAEFSVEIAEKILKDKLASGDQQKAMVNKLVDDIKIN